MTKPEGRSVGDSEILVIMIRGIDRTNQRDHHHHHLHDQCARNWEDGTHAVGISICYSHWPSFRSRCICVALESDDSEVQMAAVSSGQLALVRKGVNTSGWP